MTLLFTSIDALHRDADAVLDELQRLRHRLDQRSNLAAFCKSLGKKTGIYAVFCNGDLIYVGKTKNARQRLRNHLVKAGAKTRSKLTEFKELLGDPANTFEVSFVEVPVNIHSAIEEIVMKSRSPRFNKRAG